MRRTVADTEEEDDDSTAVLQLEFIYGFRAHDTVQHSCGTYTVAAVKPEDHLQNINLVPITTTTGDRVVQWVHPTQLTRVSQ